MSDHEVIVRGGPSFDWTGARGAHATFAIILGVITEVGKVGGSGRPERIEGPTPLGPPGFARHPRALRRSCVVGLADDPLSSWHAPPTLRLWSGTCGVCIPPVQSRYHDRGSSS